MALPDNKLFWVEKLDEISSTSMQASHMHEYFEIYYLVEGKRRYFINHTLYDLIQGDVIFVNKSDIHQTYSLNAGTKLERYLLTFSDKVFQQLPPMFDIAQLMRCFEARKIHIPTPKRHSFNALLHKLCTECSQEDTYSQYVALLHFFEVMIYLSKRSDQKSMPLVEDLTEYEDRIQEVCRYICNYYNQPITLDEIAKIAYMSPTYFSKKFKRVTGFGFNEYLNNVRVKMATNMLLESQYSITEIAMYCGYQDSNYFGDVFKRIIGVAPSKYRKEHFTL